MGWATMAATQMSSGMRVTLGSARILIADDFEGWRLQVQNLLKIRPEWQIVGVARDGIEAVSKATDLRPDVVVLDIGMPRLNGIEAAVLIRQRSPNSRIVFLTQNEDDEIRTAALSVGTGYVLKMNAATELLQIVANVLTGSQAP